MRAFFISLKGGENAMRIEIRSDSVVLDGYVNVTNRLSRPLPSPKGKFVEQILPRTFERALMNNPHVDLLFNHDKNRKLGSTKEGNLQLFEDNIGLRGIATVYDSEVMEKAKRNELRGWSFGFQVLRDNWSNSTDGMQLRSVEEMLLAEVSILDKTPAYVATSIESRGEEDSALTETRLEEFRAKVEDTTETEDKKDKKAKSKDKENNDDSSEETNVDSKEETKKTTNEENNDDSKKDKKEEKRENPQPFYFSNLENELTLLQLRKGL
jgi:HK97 family phage prohead protease